ncbi:MAG: sulfocyanin-like copper-binding protein [Acidimicrobiales bacterium]
MVATTHIRSSSPRSSSFPDVGEPRGRRRLAAAAGLVIAAVGLSACSSSESAIAPFQILLINAPTRTVQLTLKLGATSDSGGFNIDGYSRGALTVNVPLGWTVKVSCDNRSTTLSNSCAIVDNLPIVGATPPLAFVRSSTPNPKQGLPLGGSAGFSFVASRVGRYRLTSLDPGREAAGMWDWFRVTASGHPSVRT